MPNDSSGPEVEKELASLINLFPKTRSTLPTEKMNRKEARAILGYITYLENIKTFSSTGIVSTLKGPDVAKGYDKHNLDTGLIKLVGMAAREPSSDEKERMTKLRMSKV